MAFGFRDAEVMLTVGAVWDDPALGEACYDRLAEIKARYDSENVLGNDVNVEPSG